MRPANATFDGMFEVPTLQEIIHLVTAKSAALGRPGLYPETKHPLTSVASACRWRSDWRTCSTRTASGGNTAPIFIQSFEVGSLRMLASLTDLPLVQLINTGQRPYDWTASGDPRTYADMMTPAGLAEIATYARGIGPNKDLIVPRDRAGNLLAPTALIERAHAAGLVVHAWTFRNEDTFLPTDFRAGQPGTARRTSRATGNLPGELALFYSLGRRRRVQRTTRTRRPERGRSSSTASSAPMLGVSGSPVVAVCGDRGAGHSLQLLVVRQVQPQRRHRDQPCSTAQRSVPSSRCSSGVTVNQKVPAHRVLAGDDLAVVVADRLRVQRTPARLAGSSR